jgi:hypothetical protein
VRQLDYSLWQWMERRRAKTQGGGWSLEDDRWHYEWVRGWLPDATKSFYTQTVVCGGKPVIGTNVFIRPPPWLRIYVLRLPAMAMWKVWAVYPSNTSWCELKETKNCWCGGHESMLTLCSNQIDNHFRNWLRRREKRKPTWIAWMIREMVSGWKWVSSIQL